MEFQTPPLFDMTPTYIATLKPMDGLEFSGGVGFRRLIRSGVWNSVRKNSDAANHPFTRYVEINNFPEVQHQANVVYSVGGVLDSAFAVWRPGQQFDQTAFLASRPGATVVRNVTLQEGSVAGVRTGIKGYIQNLEHCNEDGTACEAYLSDEDSLIAVDAAGQIAAEAARLANVTKSTPIDNRAINLMARASLSFNDLLGLSESWGPFRIFSEVALLGVENQPVYYDNRLDRMPVLVGVHFPTFGLLDLVSIEVEYCRNPYPNSNRNAVTDYVLMPDGLEESITKKVFTKPAMHDDDWNWSVQAVKTLTAGLELKLQVANDHMRMLDWKGEFASSDALLKRPANWYYVAHLQWGF